MQHRALGARVAELDAAQLEQAGPRLGARSAAAAGCAGGTTEVRVSSTSPMRSEDTTARGTITNIIVDIITAMRM